MTHEKHEELICPRCGVNRIDRVLLGTEAEGHICGQCWTNDRARDRRPGDEEMALQ
jgi:hypothetical protein